MKLGERLHGGVHGDPLDRGSVLQRPRQYEISTALTFLGRRRRIYDDLLVRSGATTGDQVLDVGCGPGYLTRRAARVVGARGRVAGIDPSVDAIIHASRSAPRNVGFRVAAARSLPYPDQSFDVVLCCLALHHIPPDQQPTALSEMHRVLKTGGNLLIADFRPLRGRLTRYRHAAIGHSMSAKSIDQLLDDIITAGFRVTGQASHPHRLHSISATRR